MALIGAAAIAVKASSAGLAQDLGRCTKMVDDSAKGWEKRVTQIKPARMTMIADAAEMGASARKTMLMPDAAQKQEFANAAKDADILTTAIKRQEQELQRQIATFKMSADQIEIWELEQRGATKAQIDSVRALQVQRKALQDAAGAGDLATKRIQRLPELGEKIHAGFGRISMAASTFQMATSDSADGLTKTLAAVDTGISSVTVGMQLATKATTGLKAALLGTGIGAAIAAVGFLISKLSSARDDAAAATASLDADMRRRIARAAPGVRTSRSVEHLSTTVEETEDGGARVTRRERVGGGIESGGEVRRTTTDISATTIATMRAADAVAELGRRMEEAATAAGRSADYMALVRHEADLAAARADAASRPGDAAARAEADRLGSEFRLAHWSRVGREAYASVSSIESETARLSEMAATAGMSADAAAAYRSSLRDTTVSIGGFTVATREAMSPMDAHARRLAELAEIETRTGESMEFARERSLARARAEEAALDRLASARLAAAAAEERRRTEEPFAASVREMERMGDLFIRGGTDGATFARGIEMALGTARRPARALGDELRRIDEMEFMARGIDVAAGGTGAIDTSAFEDARRAAREALVPPDTTVVFARRMEDLGDAFRRGAINASDFGRATTEAMRGVLGDTRTPFEQLTERFRVIDEAIAARAGAGGDLTGLSEMQRMARARAVLSATAGVRLDMPGGVQALERGSVEAVRAINEARRSGPSDPVARTLAAMEVQRQILEEQTRVERRVAEALEGGLFAPFLG